MGVPFQVVDLETAEPVKVVAPTVAVWTMFTAELRAVQEKDILVTLNPDKSRNSSSNIRLVELMRNDRKACLKKHKEFEARIKRDMGNAKAADGGVSNVAEYDGSSSRGVMKLRI